MRLFGIARGVGDSEGALASSSVARSQYAETCSLLYFNDESTCI